MNMILNTCTDALTIHCIDIRQNFALTQSQPSVFPAQRYLSRVLRDYCLSQQNNTPFKLPKKIKKKRAQPGTIARGYCFVATPTVIQQQIFNRILGASRWIWNWGLNRCLEHAKQQQEKEKEKEEQKIKEKNNNNQDNTKTAPKTTQKKSTYKPLSYQELSNELTVLKKTTEYRWKNGVLVQEPHWLNTIPDTVLRQSLMDLGQSWIAYENGQRGTRKDKPGQPQFKSFSRKNDSATFQVDARVEEKHSCIDQNNHTIKISGLDPVHQTLSFCKTENILGDVSSFVISKKNDSYYISLSMINIDPTDIHQQKHGSLSKQRTLDLSDDTIISQTTSSKTPFVDFDCDEFPICSELNSNREGLLAIDLAAKWGGIATPNGSSTYQLITEKQQERLTQKDNNTKRFQRAQNRKIEAKYQEYGIVREDNGAWPKDAGKILAEKVKQRNEIYKRRQKTKILSKTTLSDNEKQEQIAHLHDVFFTKSKRLIALEQRLSKAHTEKRNDVVDVLHKATTDIIRKHHTIVCEKINIKAMLEDKGKHSGFHRSIASTCMAEIIRQLTYKAKWYGRNILFVSPWFPSSQLCSTKDCTYQNKSLTLSTTHWTCPMCGVAHERNDNASFNLWSQGWLLLEEFFNNNSTKNLADGSFVKGSQGVVEKTVSVAEHRTWRQATSKPKSAKKSVSSAGARFKIERRVVGVTPH